MTEVNTKELPEKIMVWFGQWPITFAGTWATTRYPANAVEYVPAHRFKTVEEAALLGLKMAQINDLWNTAEKISSLLNCSKPSDTTPFKGRTGSEPIAALEGQESAMSTLEPERHKDGDRNVIITQAVNDIDDIVNHHDPETDVPIEQGVWDRLDRMALEIERHAVSRITRYFPEHK